jgi:hypothetical protein
MGYFSSLLECLLAMNWLAVGIEAMFSRPCKTAATRMNPRFFTDCGTPDPSAIVIGSIDFRGICP